jgi:hypothetical protein
MSVIPEFGTGLSGAKISGEYPESSLKIVNYSPGQFAFKPFQTGFRIDVRNDGVVALRNNSRLQIRSFVRTLLLNHGAFERLHYVV